MEEDLRKKEKQGDFALLLEKKKEIFFLLFVLRKFAFRFEDYIQPQEEERNYS